MKLQHVCLDSALDLWPPGHFELGIFRFSDQAFGNGVFSLRLSYVRWKPRNEQVAQMGSFHQSKRSDNRQYAVEVSMARLSSQYSNNLNIQYIHYISLPYFLFPFCSCFILLLYFSFCFYIFYISSYYFIYTCLAHLFFILYSLSYMRSIFFIFIPFFFCFERDFLFSF